MRNLSKLSAFVIILIIGTNAILLARESSETDPNIVEIPDTNLPKMDLHVHLSYAVRSFDIDAPAGDL